ncbi:DUF2334 domain-containing protein [Candidatus Dojkabacteria bacterium]|uniref:DUF2334 domain-containing protein n=1 Tax=Candidatus Dojkabacteria bacterium TaxID=2099670 RepID=A0A3M0Z004_9BACT|nr:MAG: DUF2334 domain-containing protein [Candidatus Dojkabacteria bacterium]
MTKNKTLKTKNLLFAFLGLILFLFSINHISATQAQLKIPTYSKNSITWADESFSFRRRVKNENLDVADKTAVAISFDHSSTVLVGKSKPDGEDLVLIEQTQDTNHEEIPVLIYRPNETNTTIIPTKKLEKDKIYYLYYGNSTKNNKTNLITKLTEKYNYLELEDEETPFLSIKSYKRWYLKGITKELIIQSENFEVKDSALYISKLASNEFSNIPFETKSGGLFSVKLDEFQVDEYKIKLIGNINSKKTSSNLIFVKISEPVFVSWTIDWEGINPEQKFLNSMEIISEKFKIPMTHFWNPRILINLKIPNERKSFLVNWVKSRLNKGDDIAMHLHMHHDILEEAGVKPKYDAKSWDDGLSGYDIPSTEYGFDEYLKILKWGLEKMKSAGFVNIQGFRAGGWFVDTENLKAIEKAGFIYDSSARVPLPLGRNKLVQPWTVSNTTQPYYPNKENQNSDESPNMNLLEIPNNGADSYWSTSEELYANFIANYTPGSLSYESKLVTFLSHPEWFDIDQPKLNDLFGKIKLFSNELDRGPVIFTTLSSWLDYKKLSRQNK